ncbi:MAG: hypothetical protein ABFS28_01970 [Bacteroidota bacterium]
MRTQFLMTTAITIALLISGCENNSFSVFEDIGDAVTIAEDEVFALKSAEATDCDVSAARFGGHLFSGRMMISGPHLFFGRSFPDCASVSVEPEIEGQDFPKTISINYGEGCVGKTGLEKRGIITLYMTDTILNEGATYTITFEDMTIGNREVAKTAMITNEGQDADGNWVFSSESVMTSTMESGGSTMGMVRDFTEKKVWLSGFETPEIEDDVFLKSGGGSLTVNDELKFERNIIEDLLIDRSCMFPLQGIIEISRGEETMTIDYGDGECDNLAVVSKDGAIEEIELMSGRFRKGFQRHKRNMNQEKGWW